MGGGREGEAEAEAEGEGEREKERERERERGRSYTLAFRGLTSLGAAHAAPSPVV